MSYPQFDYRLGADAETQALKREFQQFERKLAVTKKENFEKRAAEARANKPKRREPA